MGFRIEKLALLIMKSRKRHMTEAMELQNQNKIRTLGEKETYKYLGILEADTIKQVKMKKKKKLKTELCSRKRIKRISTWALPL